MAINVEVVKYSQEAKSKIVGELCTTNKNWRKAISNFMITDMLVNGGIRRSKDFTAMVHQYKRNVKTGDFAYEPGDAQITFYAVDVEANKAGKAPSAASIAAFKSYIASLKCRVASRCYKDDAKVEIPILTKLGFTLVHQYIDANKRINLIYGIGFKKVTAKAPAKVVAKKTPAKVVKTEKPADAPKESVVSKKTAKKAVKAAK